MKLAAPMISRKGATSSVFNEGVQVPQKDWDAIAKKNPAINSRNAEERGQAVKKEILHGELAKYRRR